MRHTVPVTPRRRMRNPSAPIPCATLHTLHTRQNPLPSPAEPAHLHLPPHRGRPQQAPRAQEHHAAREWLGAPRGCGWARRPLHHSSTGAQLPPLCVCSHQCLGARAGSHVCCSRQTVHSPPACWAGAQLPCLARAQASLRHCGTSLMPPPSPPTPFYAQVTDAALALATSTAIAASGNVYGARPLRRWLEANVITDLSRLLIAGGCARL